MLLTPAARSRLMWRCRRGLLENDLLLERFFAQHGDALSVAQAAAIEALMDLPDNDLLDLLLARSQPQGALDRPDVCEVLRLMRRPTAHVAAQRIKSTHADGPAAQGRSPAPG